MEFSKFVPKYIPLKFWVADFRVQYQIVNNFNIIYQNINIIYKYLIIINNRIYKFD